MKVIFIKDLKNQGKKGEIKEVSDGYAQNFLIKNGYAVKQSETSMKRLNIELENNKLEDERLTKEALLIKEKLEKNPFEFYANGSKDGRMFGAISSKHIKEELEKHGYKIDKKQIKAENINVFGTHYIEVILYKNVIAKLTINVKMR